MDYPHRDGPFFLSIDGNDPSDTFMARFANPDRKVKKASQSYFRKDLPHGRLCDRSTDEPGVAFSVDTISWLSLDRVEVGGNMYCGGLCADGGIYRLRKKDGRWVVDDYKVQRVSQLKLKSLPLSQAATEFHKFLVSRITGHVVSNDCTCWTGALYVY
jgi:hypothetical protein